MSQVLPAQGPCPAARDFRTKLNADPRAYRETSPDTSRDKKFSMTEALRLDGKALALHMEAEQRERALAYPENRPVTLVVIRVGDDPASAIYVRNKVRACGRTAIRSVERAMPATTTQAELLAEVDRLNADPDVDGILVQLPLPRGLSDEEVIARIDPAKDVDGFHRMNAGALLTGMPGLRPCTPAGIMRLIDKSGIDLTGRHAVVIGRSNIVGKPVALLLLEKHATVTIVHSRTPDIARFLREADVVVAAVGRANLVKPDMIKPGALLIDVGINRLPTGKLTGDIDPACHPLSSAYTPVPGGVGPMTIAMLLENTLEAAARRRAQEKA